MNIHTRQFPVFFLTIYYEFKSSSTYHNSPVPVPVPVPEPAAVHNSAGEHNWAAEPKGTPGASLGPGRMRTRRAPAGGGVGTGGTLAGTGEAGPMDLELG